MVDLNRKVFDASNTYQAYSPNNIYKCDANNLKQVLSQILQQQSNERILIELPNTIGLSDEIINALTDNIDVRIIGGLTDEYAKSHKDSDALDHLREKATYSKQELQEIMGKFKEIESHIDPQWNDYEKALYLYEYVKYNVVYRKNIEQAPDGKWMDELGNANRTRTWDSLIGLTNQLPGGNSGGIGAKPKDYLSYNDARQLMIENDIKTLKEYHEFYKKLKNDGKNILPASAEQYYSLRGEWVGSFHFFNKIGLTDKEKHNNFLTYEEAKNYIKNFNFKDRNEYREYVRREKIPFLPVIPENTYKKDFVSMYDFLGKEKPQLLSYEEAKEFSIKNGFKTSREYFAYRKNNKNCMLPQHPERDYREWVSWADFLETNNKRKPYKKRGE